jgi:Flp pilus assembly secretin CpaC
MFVVDPEIVDVVLESKELYVRAKQEGRTTIHLYYPHSPYSSDILHVEVKGEVSPQKIVIAKGNVYQLGGDI